MDRHSGNRFNMHRAKKAGVKGSRPAKVAEKTQVAGAEKPFSVIMR
jgi:hypothetical protein